MKSGLLFPFLGHRWRFVGFLALIWSSILHAQVTVDGTFGPAGPLSGPHYAISADLGHQMGGNLFHSFGQFSIHAGESATFSGPNSVANIIGRVTGGQTSLIDGTMRSTIPGASLYLLNPAGILFGENARLDVQGSFHASTADYLRLSDGGRFDARAPEHSVLTVAPVAAFGFLGDAPAPITIDGSFLTVPAGRTLSLIGGDITLTDATVYAPGGRIDVAAVGSAGEVWSTATDLALQGFGAMGTLTLTREPTADRVMVERGELLGEMPLADLDTSGEGGGAIFIRGGRWVSRGGWVFADTYGARAGRDIQVTITGDIRFDQGSGLTADTLSAGAGGSIDLTADTLTLSNGSEIATRTVGAGDAGAVAVTVRDSVGIAGTDAEGFPSGLFATTLDSGSAGSISLDVGWLHLREGGEIATGTRGAGDGGDLTVTARHSVSLEGSSGLFASALGDSTGRAGTIRVTAPVIDLADRAGIGSVTEGSGDAGSITLEVDQLSLRRGGEIATGTRGAGDGGDLTVTARESVSIAGTDAEGFRSGLFANALEDSTGRAGAIRVTAPALDLADGARIESVTEGPGDAGSIALEVDQLSLRRGSQIATGTWGAGDGGDLTVTARDSVSLEDFSGLFASALGDSTGRAGTIRVTAPVIDLADRAGIGSVTEGSGDAGSIALEADQLSLRRGGEIAAGTRGAGDGGDLTVTARESVSLEDSGLFANALGDSTGRAGAIRVTAPALDLADGGRIESDTWGPGDAGSIALDVDQLSLRRGSVINTSTAGAGDGGDLTVTAREAVSLEDSGLFASALQDSTGRAGTIRVTAPALDLADGARIESGTWGSGDAGSITLEVDQLSLRRGSLIDASTAGAGDGGDLTVTARHLNIREGSIATSTYGDGDAGDIIINAGNVLIDGQGSEFFTGLFSSVLSSSAAGTGGGVYLTIADTLTVQQGGMINAGTFGAGNAGNVTITTPRLTLADGGKIQATAAQATGGNLFINVDHLKLFDGSEISSSVAGNELSDGGNVTLNSTNLVALSGSKITAQANQGRGGNIIVNADVFLHDAASISEVLNASSQVAGNDGAVRNNAPTTDISGSLVALNTGYLDAAGQLSPRCGTGDPDERSRFTMQGRGALPIGPDDPGMAPASRCGPEIVALTSTVTTEELGNDLLPTPPAEPPIPTAFGFNNR
jgi:filamentous hemagglutinin family protein